MHSKFMQSVWRAVAGAYLVFMWLAVAYVMVVVVLELIGIPLAIFGFSGLYCALEPRDCFIGR